MATDNSAPKIRVILTVAFSSIVILVALNFVFRSYFLIMTEEVQHDHLWKPVELIKLNEGEERNLTTSPLPIGRAMQQFAQQGRGDANALIKPEPSNDFGAMVGWLQAPNQAALEAMAAAAAAPPDAGSEADAGAATTGTMPADGGVAKAPHDAGAVQKPGPHGGTH